MGTAGRDRRTEPLTDDEDDRGAWGTTTATAGEAGGGGGRLFGLTLTPPQDKN